MACLLCAYDTPAVAVTDIHAMNSGIAHLQHLFQASLRPVTNALAL